MLPGRWIVVLLSAGLLAFVGCSGGDGGGGGASGGKDGTWSGSIIVTYVCEGSSEAFQLTIDGTSVTITDGTQFGPLPTDTMGTLTEQSPNSYTVDFENGGSIPGQLYLNPTANYALLVVLSGVGGTEGYVAFLHKGGAVATTFANDDLVGTWSGVSARLDANFAVTSSSPMSATVTTGGSGLALSGSDGDGAFSAAAPAASLDSVTDGIWIAGNQEVWSAETYEAVYGLSPDKSKVGIAFLRHDGVSNFGDCDTDIFAGMPQHKFAVLARQ